MSLWSLLSFVSFLSHRGFDLEHPAPGVAEVLGEIEVAEDLPHLLAAHERPDVVPLGIAQEVGDDPRSLFDGALAQELARLGIGDLLIREEVEGIRTVDTVACSARTMHASSIAGPAAQRRNCLAAVGVFR